MTHIHANPNKEMQDEFENQVIIENSIIRLEGGSILIREDGMINATALCKLGKRKFHDYQRMQSTQEFIKALKNTKTPPDSFIETHRGGKDLSKQGTWCHRLIAIDCARWISATFAVKVCQWVDEWTTYSSENKTKFIKEISTLEPRHNTLREKEIVAELCKEFTTFETEAQTLTGFIDILTEDMLIEVKHASESIRHDTSYLPSIFI
jgi:hypothetical protein